MSIVIEGVEYPVASADDHVCETPGVWTDRLDAGRFGDRVPHPRPGATGAADWLVDGRPLAAGALAWWAGAGPSGADPAELTDPRARLAAMDRQGIDVSVLYPGVAGPAGETFGRITDPELELACVRAYNDWLIEEWAAASPRFVPLALVPLHPVEAAVAELERAVGMGHRGLVYPALPMFLRDVPEITPDVHRPLFEACEALGVPVSFHSGVADQIVAPVPAHAPRDYADALTAVNQPVSSALFVAHLLLSQILAPHPGLRAVFAENSLAWMGFALETMDYLVEVDRLNVDTYRMMPSEVFARQCYCVGSYERLDRCPTGVVPTSRILWSTGYPGPGSTWPDTRSTLAESLGQVGDQPRRQVLWDNLAELYRIETTVPAGV